MGLLHQRAEARVDASADAGEEASGVPPPLSGVFNRRDKRQRMQQRAEIARVRRNGLRPAPQRLRQPLQVLHRCHEQALTIHPLTPSVPRPPQPVLVLRLGKRMLTADAQLPADRIAVTALRPARGITHACLTHLLASLPVLRQIEGATLPRGDLFELDAGLQRHVRRDRSVDHISDEGSCSIARVGAEHLDGLFQPEPPAARFVLIEQFERHLALGRAGGERGPAPENDAALRVDHVMNEVAQFGALAAALR